jgi:DNA polymerase-1
MDTMQLINDQVRVYTLKKGIKDTILYDEKAVEDRFGFSPKLLADFKGLRGDPSDNIIGIKGIGEKSAIDLIKNFGSLENIYKKLRADSLELREKIRPRILELLKEGEEEAKFSKMLATIRRDAPIDFELPKVKWQEDLDIKKAETLFGELEFRTMSAKLKTAISGKETLAVNESKDKNDSEEENILEELKRTESEHIFKEIEQPLIPVIKKMEDRGVLIDSDFLKKLNENYSKILKELETKIWQEAGVKFNISSPKQLGDILFNKLGLNLKYQKKTATGAKSTKESELQKMKELHPIISLVLDYRELSKLIGTYIEPIPKMVDRNGRLHTHFLQLGTATGRMASQNPNLQNIPVSSENGKVIRKAFLAPAGFKLVAFDYSQIELRIAAFLSQDQKLIEIFKSGEDVHTGVAAAVFGVSPSEVNKEMRRRAKIINFGILYGMGVNSLAQNLNTDRSTAQQFFNTYFERFNGLAKYLDKVKLEAERLGFTETFFGRRRYFGDLKSKIPYIKAAAERMAINAPIQGTSADIIKIAMKKIDDFILENNLEKDVFLILQIHDELIYEIKENLVEEFFPKIKEIMQNIISPEKISDVPIVVNVSVGQNWEEMKTMNHES